jgi:hypothetical protein
MAFVFNNLVLPVNWWHRWNGWMKLQKMLLEMEA